MSETVIKVEGLGKKYIIGHQAKGGYKTFRDQIGDNFKTVFSKTKKMLSGQMVVDGDEVEDFWALKDISFEVKQGDTLGIIGRNGAGKSTLLKILSRITEPTTGKVSLKGRVASLLEVGTGFHPELSGRENVFLNGAIMGMSRAEIKRKFDEIVDFSGVENFLDTPVKRYSSGMYVRLAFAVAAHLEPEILIVDEVLAVGDAEFQKKCLGKMKDVSEHGSRTVLFVSHNMAAIKSLCSSAIVLEKGSTAFLGNTSAAVNYYLQGKTDNQHKKIFDKEYDTRDFMLHEISINAKGKSVDEPIDEYQEIEFNTSITIKNDDAERLHVTYVIKGEDGTDLFTFSHINGGLRLKKGINNLQCVFPKGFLNVGSFYFTIYIIKDAKETVFTEMDIFSAKVQEGKREIGGWMGKEPGFIKPIFEWKNS